MPDFSATYVNYDVTITPASGTPITFTGVAGNGELQHILSLPSTLYSVDATGVYSGTFSNGSCCVDFTATPVTETVIVTVDPVPCFI